MRNVILGDDNQAAGFLVKPMDDSWPKVSAYAGKLAKAMEKSVDECPAIAFVVSRPGAGVNHHPRGFVDDDKVVIFIDDVERNFFRNGAERRAFGRTEDFDMLRSPKLQG